MAVYLKADKTEILNKVKVNEYLLTSHNPNKISMPTASMKGKVLGVTVHNTDWINVNSATTPAEQYTRATVNGNMKSVRVHYYVDNECAWQNLPLDLSGWHAADGNGNGNRKTIAIECIMSSAYNENDKKSEDNCARLAAYLLCLYNLDISHLYTHTHWLNVKNGKKGSVDYLNTAKNSYKMCPAYILPHWNNFKAKVQAYMNEINKQKPNNNTPAAETKPSNSSEQTVGFKTYLIQVVSKDGFVNIRKTPNWNDSDIVGTVATGNTKYTIVDETIFDGTKFGKLKSGAGWITLNPKYVKKV